MDYEKVVEYIEGIPKFTKKNSLEHTRLLLRELHDPQEKFKILHVAGSNGKGSVCSFLNQAMMEAGKKTGMFISPHLVKLEERFQIQGIPCSREELVDIFSKVMVAVERIQEQGEPHPSYFELLFLMAMVLFHRKQVEYVILETGLGGRLDATNAVLHPILTVITSISLEHTEILGDTIGKIAAEKAGIIKKGAPVICDASEPEALAVIRKKAADLSLPCYPVGTENCAISEITGKGIAFCYHTEYDRIDLKVPFAAEYQVINAALAVQALLLLEKEQVLKRADIQNGIAHAKWPGRMEQVREDVYLDGAHNVSGISTLLKTIKRIAGQPPILLFSMVKEKNYEEAIGILTTAVTWDKIYVTTIPGSRGIPAQELAEEFLKDKEQVICIDNNREAWEEAILAKKPGQILLCTGSLYLVGELKKVMEEEK